MDKLENHSQESPEAHKYYKTDFKIPKDKTKYNSHGNRPDQPKH
jgi:hypothetical protein